MPSPTITTQPGVRARFLPAIGQLDHSHYADAAIAVALVLLTAVLLSPSYTSLPMRLWDESRNANNAIEMAASGHWLVTTYNGLPDHWNTKPPLLIWIIAALLRAGLPALLALRLPSVVAAMATVTVLFVFCRVALRDRLAGVSAALLLLASPLFMGPHVASTGDYDALLSLFILVSVLSFWWYVNTADVQQGRWLAIAAAALTLAVLTKGIAALFVLPGLLLYLLVKRRLIWAMRDVRLWLAGLIGLMVSAGYYLGREALDPGYLRAVWQNELGGRYLSTLEDNSNRAFYYILVLLLAFKPGFLLTPLLFRPLLGEDQRRRDVVLVSILAAASLLIVITFARTKLYWYAAPLVPLLSLAVGIALTDALASPKASGTSGVPVWRQVFKPAIIVILGLVTVRNFSVENIGSYTSPSQPEPSQSWYGAFMEQLHMDGIAHNLLIMDGGVPGLKGYNPIGDFYRKDAERNGYGSVEIIQPDSAIAAETWVLTCDPDVRPKLQSDPRFMTFRGDAHCLFGQLHAGSGVSQAVIPHVGA